jgi:hypothetical protein
MSLFGLQLLISGRRRVIYVAGALLISLLLIRLPFSCAARASIDSLKQLLQSTNDLQRRVELYAALS